MCRAHHVNRRPELPNTFLWTTDSIELYQWLTKYHFHCCTSTVIELPNTLLWRTASGMNRELLNQQCWLKNSLDWNITVSTTLSATFHKLWKIFTALFLDEIHTLYSPYHFVSNAMYIELFKLQLEYLCWYMLSLILLYLTLCCRDNKWDLRHYQCDKKKC